MKNEEIAKIFYQIARFLEIDGVAFKPYAYQRAALSLESLKENVADMYRNGGKKALLQIPGVGKNIAEQLARDAFGGQRQPFRAGLVVIATAPVMVGVQEGDRQLITHLLHAPLRGLQPTGCITAARDLLTELLAHAPELLRAPHEQPLDF